MKKHAGFVRKHVLKNREQKRTIKGNAEQKVRSELDLTPSLHA